MIQKFPIAADDHYYLAFPDVALTTSGQLVCVISACTHHGDRSYSRVMLTDSADRGRTWSPMRPLCDALDHDPEGWFWNCPRISRLSDGRLVALCDKLRGLSKEHSSCDEQVTCMWLSDDEGKSWSEPTVIPPYGIVPDQVVELKHGSHRGRWVVTSHSKMQTDPGIISAQRVWWSDDQGKTWEGPSIVAQSDRYMFCEGSIVEMPEGQLVCILRENSFKGYDAFKCVSTDGGLTWSEPVTFPIPACHRPVAGMLNNGQVLITHRLMQGGHGWVGWWTQNFLAALTDVESCLAESRELAHARLLPIDFDRSPKSDTGYSGWVQFDDGEIYIVNYIVDDHHPRAQIRGYALGLDDFLLPEPAEDTNQ